MLYKTISGRKIMTFLSVMLAITVMSGLLAGQYVSSASATKKLPIYSVKTDKKQIAITFDAAWTNQDTDQLIKILKKHNATATFFIVGDWADRFPESVKAFYVEDPYQLMDADTPETLALLQNIRGNSL